MIYIQIYLKLFAKTKNIPVFSIIAQIFIHELFIDVVALLIKAKNYNSINYLTATPYFDCSLYSKKLSSFVEIFYSISKYTIYNFDKYLAHNLAGDSNKWSYYSGIAEYWIRNIPIMYLNETEFINADCLLTNISIAIKADTWFAISYTYLSNRNSNLISEIALSLTSKKLANRYYKLFDVTSSDEMKTCIDNLSMFGKNSESRLGYNGYFYTIPLLTNYISKEDLETRN